MNAPREIDRAPPHDLEAERAALGAVLLLPSVMDDLLTTLTAEDFYGAANAILWGSMVAVYEKHQRLDVTLLAAELKKSKSLESVGGYAYLAELAGSSPTAANATYYATIIADCATRRRQIEACTKGVRLAYDMGVEASEAVGLAESAVFAVRSDRGANVKAMGDVMSELLTAFDERQAGKRPGMVPSGIRAADDTASLRAGELTVLAGRPGMGKTALALNIAAGVAAQGRRVLVFSLEMARMELAMRLLATQSEVPLFCLRDNKLTAGDIERIVQANGVMSQWPLSIDDTGSHTVSEIAAIARREKRRLGLDLVVIDYLQLVEPERGNGRQSRADEVAVMSRRLKMSAKELGVPVLVLCQLNREVEKGGDKRPRLHHLRESGSIEQDADNVLFVHREEYYLTEEQKRDTAFSHCIGAAELIVAKQRNGETGTAKMLWDGPKQKFSDPAPTAMAAYQGYDEFRPAETQRDIF